jgi:hypothetical protein
LYVAKSPTDAYRNSCLHTQDLASAQEYVDFILAALGNKPTFAYLQVSVKAYWEQMCWLGPENYGALPLNVPAPPVQAVDLTDATQEESPEASQAIRESGDASGDVPEEDTEDDEPGWDEDPADIQSSRRGQSAKHTSKGTASPAKSPARSPAKSKDNSPAAKSGKKSDDEFDFLDEINSTTKLSGSNIASIKQFFGHKATPAASKAKPATTTMGAAKKFASGKHSSARDPSPQRPRAGSEGSDSDTGEYRGGRGVYEDSDFLDADEEMEPEEDGEEGQEGGEGDVAALQAHWNLATYLPEAAAQYFHFVTGTIYVLLFLRQFVAFCGVASETPGGMVFNFRPDGWQPSNFIHITDHRSNFPPLFRVPHFPAGEFMQQYKGKREQLQLIRQHSLRASDSGVFSSASSGVQAGGGDGQDAQVSATVYALDWCNASRVSS